MAFASGSGTLIDPYQIYTVEDLFETTASGDYHHYILMNDLDLSAYSPWITLTNEARAAWVGSLDGNNKTISNLTLTPDSIVGTGPFVFYDYAGLFGDLNIVSTESAYVKNLNIDTVNITFDSHSTNGLTFIGTLCARSTARNISNVHITNLSCSITIKDGDSISYNVGGMFADSYESTVYSSSISASYFELSGLVDLYDVFHASIFSIVDSTAIFEQCYVKDCTAKSDIRYTDEFPYEEIFIAPFYLMHGYIKDAYVVNCLLTSSNYIAGMAWALSDSNIYNLYSSINPGNTPTTNIYPFIYSDVGGLVNNCYYESGSYQFDTAVGTIGLTASNQTEMKMSESYEGWDFNTIWRIDNV